MGALTSRQNATVEEADVGSNHAYKYPPRSGNYFGSHFIMGGERFDTPQPEAYLFGENADLNFLGSRPTAFPYPPPQASEPTKTLKSLVNIRKESVRFVKAPDSATKIHGDGSGNKGNSFNLEFVFDSDAKCAITIYYFCTEEINAGGLSYLPRDSSLTSETYHYKRGVNQTFSQNSHIFNPSLFAEDELTYNSEKDVFPVAIHCVVEEEARQSHTTICVIDHHVDGTFVLRALKQKIFVDGLCYLLQEIYGIENKNINKAGGDDDTDDNGSECVICMCDTRDTLILPCRHLCLCNSCADSLRYQANNCPICRAPFRALLQIRAVQKGFSTSITSPQSPQDGNCDHTPAGYVPVSLLEALNGPPAHRSNVISVDAADGASDAEAVQAAEKLNKSAEGKTSPKVVDKKEKLNKNGPEFRMSILLNKEHEENTSKDVTTSSSKATTPNNITKEKSPRLKSGSKSRDTVKLVNEKSLNLSTPDADDDSDAEKLSPLLNSKSPNDNIGTALHIDGVDESIDDTDTDPDDDNDENNLKLDKKQQRAVLPSASDAGDVATLAGAEDSDYYTPEDPHTTILSPLCPEKNKTLESSKSKDSLVGSASPLAAIKETANSLPDSPISGNSASTRSSGDSYSSSSSTRQLLSSVPVKEISNHSIKICDDKNVNHENAVNV